jgi:hypothetical protein
VKPPKSRLLSRIEAALARARHPIEGACLRAERAGLLARLGQLERAKADITALHAQFDAHPHPAVSAWLALTEGWLLHYTNLSAGARDKMKRAQALSSAAGLLPLHALSSAWLAQMDYQADDIGEMLRNVALALQNAAADGHGARSRACMVMALGYHYCERMDLAQPWYARSREHATQDGDEPTLSALNYNISSHRAHQALQAAVFGGDALRDARLATVGYESSLNLDEWIGAQTLDALVPVQRASLASVQGQHAQAIALYDRHMDDARQQGLARMAPVWLADLAWCRWHAGDPAGARCTAEDAASGIDDSSMHLDDRATAHGRLAQVWRLLGEEASADRHAALASEHRERHRQLLSTMLEQMENAQLHP